MQSDRNVVQRIISSLIGTRNDWRLRVPLRSNPPHPSVSWVGPIVMIVATLVGWFAFRDAVGDEDNVAFALFIGSVSILLMAWSNLLSTRAKWLEPLFGGLDVMYRWHRWFAVLSVAAMWYHIQIVDDVKGIRGASKSVADSAEDLAGTGETLLYILVIVSLLRWLPYRWWKISHKFLILPFVFSCWHFHTATKPYANSSAWGRWFQVLMVMGIVAWVYRVVWCDIVRRGRRYVVSSVTNNGSITTLEMRPDGRALKYRNGQFVFIRVGKSGAWEPHPFTIASHPNESLLRVHVKTLGDWSNKLHLRAQHGERVWVEGPYGALQLFPHRQAPVLWIAGGVGITPFLGALSDPRTIQHKPHLFYAVRTRSDAAGLDEVMKAHADGRIVLHLHVSAEDTRLCEDDVRNAFGDKGLTKAHIVMCGPDSLVRNMTTIVRALGARRVHHEAFDIRTGVGPDLSVEIDQIFDRVKVRTSKSP